MKKMRPMLPLLLAALLLTTALGCGSKSQAPVSTAPATSSAAVTPATSPTVAQQSAAASPATTTPKTSTAPSTAVTPEATSTASPTGPKDYLKIGQALMLTEAISGVRYGMTAQELTAVLGQPDTKGEEELWGADGLKHSDWSYSAKGLKINMARKPTDTAGTVYSIFAAAPCTGATMKGIAIGAAKDKVLSAYGAAIDATVNTDMNTRIIIGSVYGGLLLDMENGTVKTIYIGASAE